MALHPLPIGYLRLQDRVSILDITQPVYGAPQIESISGTGPGQHTDHHYIMVTQPDALNRVHYCRLLVVKLIFHNGIAFAPDYREQLGKLEDARRVVHRWLGGKGQMVQAGMVVLPEGIRLIDSEMLENWRD